MNRYHEFLVCHQILMSTFKTSAAFNRLDNAAIQVGLDALPADQIFHVCISTATAHMTNFAYKCIIMLLMSWLVQ